MTSFEEEKDWNLTKKKCQKGGKKKPSKKDSIKRGIGNRTEGPPSILNMAKRSCVKDSAKMHKKLLGMISGTNPTECVADLD